jgi:hypothetical protein
MRIRYGWLLALAMLLAGCGNTRTVAGQSSPRRRFPAAQLALSRVVCTNPGPGGPFTAAAEAQAAGARSLYQAPNFTRALRVAGRHLERWAIVTLIRVEPAALDVTSVFAGHMRSFRIGADGSYSLEQSGTWTREAVGFDSGCGGHLG